MNGCDDLIEMIVYFFQNNIHIHNENFQSRYPFIIGIQAVQS